MPSTRRSVLAACATGVGALAGCLSTEKPTTEGSWPRRTLTSAHTGYSATDGPTTDLHTVWTRRRYNDGPPTSPVVEDGTLYLAYSREVRDDDSGGTWIEAFDAATGDSRWTTELFRADEFHSYFYHSDSLVVDGDRVFCQTRPGLTMLTTDGQVQWTFDNLYGAQQVPDVVTPVLTDDVVVVGTYGTARDERDEIAYGIDPATGDERWRAPFTEVDGATLQLVGTDDAVYVPFLRDGLVALDPATGEERWRWDGPINGTPTVVDDLLLVTLRRGDEYTLVAMDRRDRSVRWQQSIGQRGAEAGLSVVDGRVYLLTAHGIEARRLETGGRVWRFGGDRVDDSQNQPNEPLLGLHTTPVVSGDAVYAQGATQREAVYGYLFVVDAATGEEVGRVEMGPNVGVRSAIPAVTSELVFLTSTHGDLYAFGECSVGVAGRCPFG